MGKKKKKKDQLSVSDAYKKIKDREDFEIIYSEFKYDREPIKQTIEILLPVVITLLVDKLINQAWFGYIEAIVILIVLVIAADFSEKTGKRNLYIQLKINEKSISNLKDSKFIFESFECTDSPFPEIVTLKYRQSQKRKEAKKIAKELGIKYN